MHVCISCLYAFLLALVVVYILTLLLPYVILLILLYTYTPLPLPLPLPLSLLSAAFYRCSLLKEVTFEISSALTAVGVLAFVAPGLSRVAFVPPGENGGSVTIDEGKASLLRVAGTMMYSAKVNGVAFAPYGPLNVLSAGVGNVVISNTVTDIASSKLVEV